MRGKLDYMIVGVSYTDKLRGVEHIYKQVSYPPMADMISFDLKTHLTHPPSSF